MVHDGGRHDGNVTVIHIYIHTYIHTYILPSSLPPDRTHRLASPDTPHPARVPQTTDSVNSSTSLERPSGPKRPRGTVAWPRLARVEREGSRRPRAHRLYQLQLDLRNVKSDWLSLYGGDAWGGVQLANRPLVYYSYAKSKCIKLHKPCLLWRYFTVDVSSCQRFSLQTCKGTC